MKEKYKERKPKRRCRASSFFARSQQYRSSKDGAGVEGRKENTHSRS